MTVLNEIKVHLVQRVKGQRSAERSTGERSTMLSSTLKSLMKSHLSTSDCFVFVRNNRYETFLNVLAARSCIAMYSKISAI